MKISGKIDAQAKTYTNETFGIKFTLPEGFSFYDDAQMAEMNQSIRETATAENIIQALESGNAFFDMVGSEANGGSVTSVIAYASTPDIQALDAAGYLKYAKESLEPQLSSVGAVLKDVQSGTYKNPETEDTFAFLKVQFEISGALMHEYLVCLKAGNYFMTVTLTAPDEAELDKFFEHFALVK